MNSPDERFPALVRDGIVLARATQALIHECFAPEHHDPEMGQMGSQLLSDYDQLRCRGQRLVEAGESPGGVQLLEGLLVRGQEMLGVALEFRLGFPSEPLGRVAARLTGVDQLAERLEALLDSVDTSGEKP